MTFDELWRSDLPERRRIDDLPEAQEFDWSDSQPGDCDSDEPHDADVDRFIEWLEASLE